VPGDVSGVFWSPDRKYVLGASGESLWLIDIPSLQSRRLGNRTDWDADDAGWLPDSKVGCRGRQRQAVASAMCLRVSHTKSGRFRPSTGADALCR
jgi:hypothetical protein